MPKRANRTNSNATPVGVSLIFLETSGTAADVELETKTMVAIRDRINSQEQREACVRDAVAAFDSLVGQYVRELVRRIPLTSVRMNRLQSSRFHNVSQVPEELNGVFDIDIYKGIDASDRRI